MNKILLLMACAVTLVAAGRIAVNPATAQGIGRMSLGDLQRQRFILDIVQNIQEPLQNDELIRLDQGLIVEPQRYRGGIDGEMQRVIDLDRQRRLLDEHQICSVVRVEDVQQLRGIYRLLVRAVDFETLQRNVVYLRRNINPVLLINALVRAIRDREDTQSLIVPAVQELLPELYLDHEVVEQVQRIQEEQTQRPSLIDVVGLGHRGPMNPMMNILNPWREMRMHMALIRQQGPKSRLAQLGKNRVVIPIQGQEQGLGTSLLTDDIGLRNFVQNLIQELALLEGEDESQEVPLHPIPQGMEQDQDDVVNTGRLLYVNRRRIQQQQEEQQEDQQENISGNERQRFMRVLRRDNSNNNDDDNDDDDDEIRMARVPLQRGIGQRNIYLGSRQGGAIDLPTVNADSDRLLHVNRRRVNSIQQEQEQLQQTGGGQRVPGWMRGSRYSEGRRVVEQDQVQQRYGNQVESFADQLESVSRDDERLVHINRRRLNQIGVGQQQKMLPRRVASIGEVRQVLDHPIREEDILKLIRSDHRLSIMSDDEILAMLKRNREKRLQNPTNNDDDADEQQVGDWTEEQQLEHQRQGQRVRRSLTSYRQQQGLDTEMDSRRSEILLHNLRQLVARLNQETIAQGQTIEKKNLWLNNPRQTQSERYALRLDQIRIDSLRSRQLLDQINQIEQRMQQAIGQLNIQSIRGQFREQRQVEALIADVLLGRLGQVGILRIVRELVQENNLQVDRSGLGIRLSDPLIQYTLRRIVSIVDDQREQLLGGYRREQLDLQGVSINDVRVDKLRTRIEETDMDLTNLIGQQGRQTQRQEIQRTIVGRQRRLNNKPFLIDMDISSERAQDVVIRVFLGPSLDSQGRDASLDQRRRDFLLLNAINVELKSGINRIQQRSIDIPWTSRDVTPLSEIYRRVMMQLHGQQELDTQELVGENGRFPQRLLLPRGRPEGLPMQLLVIVSPVLEQQQRSIIPSVSLGIGSASLQDIRPLGYPLDRPITNEQELLQLPNVQLQDVVIVQEN
ncbi:fat-body protein 1 [Drosophila guanche]|uniref:Blast:Fat-body protein 1 n=1 Tax=Drosophila guanche TaxID=7266 RepID=A0A3B0JYC6_DROGU|nr:fat-body protein 1 [Drosophila guanche]SPP76098.1 blast:Fat-body protein 1 [Drosophila guanche]